MSVYPATVVSSDSSIAHLQNVKYYEKKAFDNIKKNLVSYLAMDKKPFPLHSGTTMQFFQNSIATANTVPVSEGTPGAPIGHFGSVIGTATVSQYSDFQTFSDYIEDTAISPVVEEQAVELGHRAALTIDSINYTQWDAQAAAASNARIDLAGTDTTPEYFSAQVALRAVASLQGVDVKPKDNGKYFGVFHPLVRYDYLSDNAAGGTRDILKYNDYGELKMGPHDSFTLDGVTWLSSTNVPSTSNYQSGGETAYHSFVIGKDAFWCTSLFMRNVPGSKNFKASISRFKEGQSPADPAGLISAAAWYKFYYGNFVLPDAIERFRRIRSEVSIS